MWIFESRTIDPQTVKTSIMTDSGPLSVAQTIQLWRNDPGFREQFTSSITQSKFTAFFWETPPVTKSTLNQPFEYVLVESTSLERLQPDSTPFKKHFATAGSKGVTTFPNLGGDAFLVVPTPVSEESHYSHFAKFLRGAPNEQVHDFWQTVGEAMNAQMSDRPIWLSTAGMGVSWLHLRLDSRPKYYRHEPYKHKRQID